MPINPVWPKPYKWLVDPRLVHPGQRWVWHTKPRFIVPAWEDARPGTAQRYRRLRYGRGSQHDWRLNTSASTIRTRRHRPDPVLRRLLDGPHGPPVARRPLRLPAPLERGACAHGQCAAPHAPRDRHRRAHLPDGVASRLSKLTRDRLQETCTPTWFGGRARVPRPYYQRTRAPDHAVVRLRPENSIPSHTRCSTPEVLGPHRSTLSSR